MRATLNPGLGLALWLILFSSELLAQQTFVPAPEFSHQSGFYDSPISLSIHAENDARIFFTTDGSQPDSTSFEFRASILLQDRSSQPNNLSTISTTPPNPNWGWQEPNSLVKKASIIRAIAYDSEGNESRISTATYFIGEEFITHYYTFPIISIVTDSLNFFDDEIGLMVPGNTYTGELYSGNYFERGEDWERPAHFSFFDEQGTMQVNQNVGVRIHGGATRRYPQKSLRIYARSDYDELSNIEYELFPGNRRLMDNQVLQRYKRIILRPSGDDWFHTMFKDAFIQSLVYDKQLETQAYRPTIVFINGEYWGIHNMRERYDGWYIQRNYDIHRDDVGILVNIDELNTGIEADRQHYIEMRDYAVSQDLRQQEHFDSINRKMDVDNYIDYYALQMFIANADWPHNNARFWRKRIDGYQPDAPYGHDGRWRWMVFDLDGSFGFPYPDGWASYDFDMFYWVTGVGNDRNGSVRLNALFNNLLENESFQKNLINTMMDDLNTRFRSEVMLDRIGYFFRMYLPEIQEHILRHPNTVGGSGLAWIEHIDVLREFAENRPEYMLAHLREFFELDEPVTFEIDLNEIEGGHITLNRTPLTEETPGIDDDVFLATYFEEIPIQLSAISEEGYNFVKWVVEEEDVITQLTDRDIKINPRADIRIKAVFERDIEDSFFPEPFVLSNNTYTFDFWDASSEPATFPDNMVFVYMAETEPGPEAEIAGAVSGSYDLDSRTRINGLGADGFAFINTSNLEGNPGFPGRQLGGAILALDTRDSKKVKLSWQAGTVRPNSRIYNFSLEYRTDVLDDFSPLLDENGLPIIYERNQTAGHTQEFENITLPAVALGQENVQLFWRYYFTGERESQDSGARSKLKISNITVKDVVESSTENKDDRIEEVTLLQNYPNPFNSKTVIPFEIHQTSQVRITVYDILGQPVQMLLNDQISAGRHEIRFDGSSISSGMYVIVLQTDYNRLSRKMLLIR